MLVVPEHDRLHGPWEIVTSGAVHRATQARPATERHRFPTLATMPQRMLSVLIGGDAKFALFHETIQAAGITRSFFGHIESWSFSILADTARAGAALRAFVLGRRQRA